MFDSVQVHYAPIEVPEKEKEPGAFSIHDLMDTHIAALFIKAGINDDFDKGLYSFHWKKMLKKERKRLRDAQYYGEANRVLDKIAEINSYNRIDSNTHKKQTKAVTNNDACSDADTKPANTKVIQANCNEFEFSGLLKIPAKIDDWFEVIDVMTKDFFSKQGKMPTKAQAWAQLCDNPPEGYGISISKDSTNKDCLDMAGYKPLKKTAFDKRWPRYIKGK